MEVDMAALDGDVLIHKYELFNEMAAALAELQTGLRDRMTPKDILGMILEAEPVDPVKHGHWIKMNGERGYECSECGWESDTTWDFCPNCGALNIEAWENTDEVEE